MKQITCVFSMLFIVFSGVFISCNTEKKTDDNEKKLIEKEHGLLIKEHGSNEKTDSLSKRKTANNLNFIKEWNGKYPSEVKLLDNHTIKVRLEKLLGGRYGFVKETWAVESPIEIVYNTFIASACQAHNCSDTNFMIAINIKKNLIYVGVRENRKVTIYAEDKSELPDQLLKWSKEG